jgi:hypothetical protein
LKRDNLSHLLSLFPALQTKRKLGVKNWLPENKGWSGIQHLNTASHNAYYKQGSVNLSHSPNHMKPAMVKVGDHGDAERISQIENIQDWIRDWNLQ